MKTTVHQKNQIIYREGEKIKNIYLLKSGTVSLWIYDKSSHKRQLELIQPGQIFGFKHLGENKYHFENAEVLEDAILEEYDKSELKNLFTACFDNVMQQFSNTSKKIHDVLNLSAEQAVAQFLLDHEGEQYTHERISEILWLTRETVSYAFMKFRKNGWISGARKMGVVEIAKREKLVEFVKGS